MEGLVLPYTSAPFQLSPTANRHDLIAAVELALVGYKAIFGHLLGDACEIDPDLGDVLPVVTVVIDNKGRFDR